MKEIRLGNDRGVALVDDEDYELVSRYKWRLLRGQRNLYVITWFPGTPRAVARMHRLITGATDGEWVDHINHDGLDNRRANLRICTASQNQANRLKLSPCSSRYKGVSWYPRDCAWRASAKLAGKNFFLGCFDFEEDAARAYNVFARERFGEFALLNDV
jgi:hypothetical protein